MTVAQRQARLDADPEYAKRQAAAYNARYNKQAQQLTTGTENI
jgi:hypothetical protein